MANDRKVSGLTGIVLVVVLSPLLIAIVLCFLIYSLVLKLMFWAFYCTRGARVLFIYSDSPVWKEYVEGNIFPELPETAIKLNWSERRNWKGGSLPVLIFKHYGGSREFNPMGIIVRPFRRTKLYRFWKPFKEFQHGKVHSLEVLRNEFLTDATSSKDPPPPASDF